MRTEKKNSDEQNTVLHYCAASNYQDLRNRKVLSLEWKNDVVMDDNSGDDDTGEVR